MEKEVNQLWTNISKNGCGREGNQKEKKSQMKDETYLFVQDVREKKSTARSARYKRTHNGKSGRVKLPSDYMTKKELMKMNGEVKSYRLNEPMPWKEFKAMPDDIKITYVKLLREKFNCFDSAIAEMMGINKVSFSQEIKRLGLGCGTKHGGNRKWEEKEAFYAWVHGVPSVAIDEIEKEYEAEDTEQDVPVYIATKEQLEETGNKLIPTTGNMVFEGKVEEVLKTISVLLGGANVHISVTWDVLEGD